MTITTIPLQVAADENNLHSQVGAYIKSAKEKAADGITVAEFCELSIGAMRLAIAGVDHMKLNNTDKQQIVVSLVGTVFDQLADAIIPLPLRPVWWIVKPAFRSLSLSLAAGACNALVPLIRNSTA